jgi:hypothetical protein
MTDNNSDKIRNYILALCLTVYIISLTQTAITYNDFDGQKTHSSISLLFMGGLAILGGGLFEWFIWLANPLYFVGLFLFFKTRKKSIYFSATATILSLSFTTWKEILAAENGRVAKIETLNLGYWLWTISLILLTIGTIYYFTRLKNNKKEI